MDSNTFFDNFGHLADAPNGIQKLRELILQLAVRGKLVPQDPADEPASKLIERIRVEKDRLVKEKKIRKAVVLPPVTAEEIPFELQQGWEWVRLGELREIVEYGTSTKAQEAPKGVPILRMNNVSGGAVSLANLKYVDSNIEELPKLYLKKNDLLFNRTNSYELVGKTGIFTGESDKFTFASYLIRIRVLEQINPHFVNHVMNSLFFRSTQIEPEITQQCGQANFNGTKLVNSLIPLPPFAEQKRIVLKVDQLMVLCDELESRQEKTKKKLLRLNNAALDGLASATDADQFAAAWQLVRDSFDFLYTSPETITKLRQAILQLAVDGKLLHHENFNDWRQGVLGDVVQRSEAGWSPQCENRPRTGDEWGVLKVSAVSWDKFKAEENKALPRHLPPREEYEVKLGDFLVSRANTEELVAKSVVVTETPKRLLLSDKTVRIHFRSGALPQYFSLVNNSPSSRSYYAAVAGGTSSSMKNVTRQQILSLPVLIPPLPDQHLIVVKVDKLMELCDRLESQLSKLHLKADRVAAAACEVVAA